MSPPAPFPTNMNNYFDPLADEDYVSSNTALTNKALRYLSLTNTINFNKYFFFEIIATFRN